MTIKIFDVKSTIFYKNKSVKNWGKYNFIYTEISKVIFEKIFEIKKDFNNILVITSDKDEVLKKIKNLKFKKITLFSEYKDLHNFCDADLKINKINGYVSEINLNEKFDLIVTNLYLHRIDDIKNFLDQIKKLIDPNGLHVCSYFGGKSLIELRNSLIKTDEEIKNKVFQRIIPFIDMIDATNLFNNFGFKEIVSDKVTLQIEYEKVLTLLKDIKGMGENNCLLSRCKGLFTKKYIDLLEENYVKNNQNKKITATCDIIFLSMWGS